MHPPEFRDWTCGKHLLVTLERYGLRKYVEIGEEKVNALNEKAKIHQLGAFKNYHCYPTKKSELGLAHIIRTTV